MKVFGERIRTSGRPLSQKRGVNEARALKIFYQLSGGKTPEPYFFDPDRHILLMEDISTYKNLRKQLMEGEVDPGLAQTLASYLCETLIPSMDLVLDRAKKKNLAASFNNPDMCDISEDLVFTEPYYNYKDRNILTPGTENLVQKRLYDDKDLQAQVLYLKDRFQNCGQALIHGDLHTGSIFVKGTGMKALDMEFSFYGPAGYDIGNVWGNFFFSLAYHKFYTRDQAKENRLAQILEDLVDLTIEGFHQALFNQVPGPYLNNRLFLEDYFRTIISDSFGYAGTEIIRRVVGDSKVEELLTMPEEIRKKADSYLIETGIQLIKARRQLEGIKGFL